MLGQKTGKPPDSIYGIELRIIERGQNNERIVAEWEKKDLFKYAERKQTDLRFLEVPPKTQQIQPTAPTYTPLLYLLYFNELIKLMTTTSTQDISGETTQIPQPQQQPQQQQDVFKRFFDGVMSQNAPTVQFITSGGLTIYDNFNKLFSQTIASIFPETSETDLKRCLHCIVCGKRCGEGHNANKHYITDINQSMTWWTMFFNGRPSGSFRDFVNHTLSCIFGTNDESPSPAKRSNSAVIRPSMLDLGTTINHIHENWCCPLCGKCILTVTKEGHGPHPIEDVLGIKDTIDRQHTRAKYPTLIRLFDNLKNNTRNSVAISGRMVGVVCKHY